MAILKKEDVKKGWVIGRNGMAMPRSAFNLSELLEEQRQEAELSKAAFARKLGIPKQTLHRLLNGTANPTVAYIKALAEKLNLDFHPKFVSVNSPLLSEPKSGAHDNQDPSQDNQRLARKPRLGSAN